MPNYDFCTASSLYRLPSVVGISDVQELLDGKLNAQLTGDGGGMAQEANGELWSQRSIFVRFLIIAACDHALAEKSGVTWEELRNARSRPRGLDGIALTGCALTCPTRALPAADDAVGLNDPINTLQMSWARKSPHRIDGLRRSVASPAY